VSAVARVDFDEVDDAAPGSVTVADISVVVCAYTHARWDDLCASIESVLAAGAGDVILVVDHNPGLLRRCEEHFRGITAVPNVEARGLSGARIARGSVVAFIDDDAVAAPDWLERMADAYDSPDVIAVGGHIEPEWRAGQPRWFPSEFRWVVGCSYRGLPRERRQVRNLIGCNMSFRREAFNQVGGFVSGIGRIGVVPVGCEETELCIRVRQRWPHREIVYLPDVRVRHNVGRSRAGVRYFASRCFAEGRSKAQVAASVGRLDALSTERTYVRETLASGVMRGCSDALRGDPWGLARALAILTGLGVTAAGYAKGRVVDRHAAATTTAS
jgi:GT2 family glycosyltransferase